MPNAPHWLPLALMVLPLGGCTDATTSDTGAPTDTGPLTADTADTATVPGWTDGTHSCEADRYRPFSVQGWAVCVDSGVFDDEAHGEAVLSLLASDLTTLQQLVPAPAADYLRGVRIWVEQSSDWSGAVYHPSAGWLEDNGYPTYWAESIQLANSADYLSWTAIQPAIVLHELSHAWHHQVLGYDDPQIADAYAQAMASGRYDDVAYAGGGTAEAYATTDDREYFAELTEAWFWENDFYPFVREELLTFDPLGAEVIEASWARVPD